MQGFHIRTWENLFHTGEEMCRVCVICETEGELCFPQAAPIVAKLCIYKLKKLIYTV